MNMDIDLLQKKLFKVGYKLELKLMKNLKDK